MGIISQAITVFLVQLVFIGCRTWNVRSIAELDTPGALLSGAMVHLAWLAGIAIGATSAKNIIMDGAWEQWPIILGSLTGGLIGTYLSLERSKKKNA